jgi:phage FluMu protein Com
MFSTSTLVDRIRIEYETMPGLKLTQEQACRLWGADTETCLSALQALIDQGFLHRTGADRYVALPRPGRVLRVGETSASTSIRCPHCQKLNTMGLEQANQHGLNGTFRCVACGRIVSFHAMSA